MPVEDVDAAEVGGLRTDDVLGAVICREDGVASPPATARELVRRAAERGVEVRERTDAREVDGDVLVVACGPRSGELFEELPIRPLVRQLVDVGPVDGLPETLPMIVEEETTFHFRRRDAFLRLALREPTRALVERRGRRRGARAGRARAARVPLSGRRETRPSSARGRACTT